MSEALEARTVASAMHRCGGFVQALGAALAMAQALEGGAGPR